MRDMTPRELLALMESEEMFLVALCYLHARHPALALQLLHEYSDAVRDADRIGSKRTLAEPRGATS